MDNTTTIPFSQFLQDIAVLSQRQADTLASSLNDSDTDENQCVFKLADFLKTLSPSDYYDQALRLYLLWKKGGIILPSSVSSPRKQPQQEQKYVSSSKINVSPQLKYNGLSHYVPPDSSRNPHNKHKKMPSGLYVTGEQQVHHQQQQENTKTLTTYGSSYSNGSGLFTALHNEKKKKELIEMENEQRRMVSELEGCTFQPNQSKTNMSIMSSTDVFERLQQDLRKEKEAINQQVRFENEIKGCTFMPITNSHLTGSRRMLSEEENNPNNVSKNNVTSSLNQTFDRLYQQYQLKRHASLENELKRQSLEVKDCTFRPALSTRHESVAGMESNSTDRFSKLHNLHSERQITLMKKKMEQTEEEVSKCSFTPYVLPTSAKKAQISGKEVYERIREWNDIKKQKLEIKMLEKAKRESNKELDLPAKKRNEPMVSPVGFFDRLYQDKVNKKVKKENIEKQMMKEIGATFTPKTNVSRNSSAKKVKESPRMNFFSDLLERPGSTEQDVSRPVTVKQQKSPTYIKAADKKVREQEAASKAEYRKLFINDMQSHFAGNPGAKTLTFGYH